MRNSEKYKAALEEIYAVLGPSKPDCPDNRCEGCRHEMAAAAEVARKALQLPKPRKSYKRA